MAQITRVCAKCRRTLPIEKFPPSTDRRSTGGTVSRCRPCHDYLARWRQTPVGEVYSKRNNDNAALRARTKKVEDRS
jgi:hypothetical protein